MSYWNLIDLDLCWHIDALTLFIRILLSFIICFINTGAGLFWRIYVSWLVQTGVCLDDQTVYDWVDNNYCILIGLKTPRLINCSLWLSWLISEFMTKFKGHQNGHHLLLPQIALFTFERVQKSQAADWLKSTWLCDITSCQPIRKLHSVTWPHAFPKM